MQTARLVNKRDFELRPFGLTDVKGLAEQMELYELLAVLPRRRRPYSSPHMIGHPRRRSVVIASSPPSPTHVNRPLAVRAVSSASQATQDLENRNWSMRCCAVELRRLALILDGQALRHTGHKGYRIILDMLAGLFALEPDDDRTSVVDKIAQVLAGLCMVRRNFADASRLAART